MRNNFVPTQKKAREYTQADFDKMRRANKRDKIQRGRKEVEY